MYVNGLGEMPESYFKSGYCGEYAVALQRVHPNWELAAYITREKDPYEGDWYDSGISHAFCIDPEGHPVDVTGAWTSVRAMRLRILVQNNEKVVLHRNMTQASLDAISELNEDVIAAVVESLQDRKVQRNPSRSVDVREEPTDYRGEHMAPDRESGSPLHDVTANGTYPEDIYSWQGARYYGDGDDNKDLTTINIIKWYHNKPNKQIRVFRAVPKQLSVQDKIVSLEKQMAYILKHGKLPADVSTSMSRFAYYDKARAEVQRLEQLPPEPKRPRQQINPNDWVTINRAYAVDHGKSSLRNEYTILSKVVSASDLFTDGDSIHEWGWDPLQTKAPANSAVRRNPSRSVWVRKDMLFREDGRTTNITLGTRVMFNKLVHSERGSRFVYSYGVVVESGTHSAEAKRAVGTTAAMRVALD